MSVDEEVVSHLYEIYTNIVNHIDIPEEERFTKNDFSIAMYDIKTNIDGVIKYLDTVECDWVPRLFSICCNEYGEDNYIDLEAYISGSTDDGDSIIEFSLTGNEDLPEWLFETAEDAIDRLINGDETEEW